MVGIPGKSKGCHTCRKRKIRCDLQQPDCQKCIKSGRVCEGYKRGAVFLNRTANGWAKRQRLEEAQPRDENDRSSTQSPNSSRSTPTPPLEPREQYWPAVHHVSDAPVKRRMFQGIFLENYLPSAPKYSRDIVLGPWLTEAVRLNNPGPALEIALQALCITRVGRFTGHQDLIYRGKIAYGQALRTLYTALGSPKHAARDETLAAAMVLAAYEMWESTTESVVESKHAHHEHMLGIDRLVQCRGHGQAKSPLGEALMKNITYGSMVRGIQFRKASRFKYIIDEMKWDTRGRLYVNGHNLAALLEDLDQYRISGQKSLATSAEFLKRCVQWNAALDKWFDDLESESPSPMYWITSTDAPPGGRYAFANILLAQLIQDYWALRLVMTVTIAYMCSQVPPGIPLTFQKMIQGLQMQNDDARQIELATNIMETMGFCTRDEHGLSSVQKSVFSGRVAIYALRSHPPEHLAIYEKLFRDLSDKKGLRFATEIGNQEMSKWTPVLTERRKP